MYLGTLVTVAVLFSAIEASNDPLFWFSTREATDQVVEADFRGCYGEQCLYVAPKALSHLDWSLGPYDPQISLWAVADQAKQPHRVTLVFSEERPVETSQTLWITPIAKQRVVPATFDPTPYLTDEPDPIVAKLVSSISQDRIQARVEQLSNDFWTRNSLSPDAVAAAHHLLNVMNEVGCQNTRLHNFRAGYSPNVICELPGYDTQASAVYVGAHYDCRSTGVNNPTQRAPGADDNGSGTAGLLDILTAAVDLIRSDGISFRRRIVFCLFAGEEQGLVGSNVFVSQLRNAGEQIIGMVGLDMIGYPQPNAPTTLYWMSSYTTANLTNLGIELATTYLGDDTIVTRTGACCSDQQSFFLTGLSCCFSC